MISDALWHRKLHADPHVLGRKNLLNGKPYEIVGVTSPQFPFLRGRQLAYWPPLPEHTEYWIPLTFSKADLVRAESNMDYLGIARLKPGVSIQQAQADLNALEKVISKGFKTPLEIDPIIEPLQAKLTGGVRTPLYVLFGAVCLVLLIVCINLMNLMLVRATGRRREWAIRLAVGAGLRQIIRDTLTESLLLALSGGGLGTLLAVWLLEVVRSQAPFDLPRVNELHLDPIALVFTVGVAVASAVLFGLLPAWQAARTDPQEALQTSGRTATTNKAGQRLGRACGGGGGF